MAQDVREFTHGNGLKQKTIYLQEDGQYSTYFMCDVCPGRRTYGNYTKVEDKVVLRDTIQYKYVPYYAAPEDTVVETRRYLDTLYMGTINELHYLFYDKPTLNSMKNTNDIELLERLTQGQVPSATAVYKEVIKK